MFQDVVPRRAYYDNRILAGKPRNMVVVLTEMLDTKAVEDSISSCKLNGYSSDEVRVIREDTSWVRSHKPGHTHCNAIIHCIGFPKVAIRSGSTVNIIYKRKNESRCLATEKPLVLMNTPCPEDGKNTVVVCATFYGNPPYFNEWLKYQKALNVDKVHMNVEKSFAVNAIEHYPFLKEAVDSGFATIDVWENYIGDKIFYYSQVTKYQDCVMRYTGVYEFAFVYDSDDFFIPMLPGTTDIRSYIARLFSEPLIGSFRVSWKRYNCTPNALIYEELQDGNVTQSLSNFTSKWIKNYKTAYRLCGTDIVGVHTEIKLLPGYRVSSGESSLAYVAHMRPSGVSKC